MLVGEEGRSTLPGVSGSYPWTHRMTEGNLQTTSWWCRGRNQSPRRQSIPAKVTEELSCTAYTETQVYHLPITKPLSTSNGSSNDESKMTSKSFCLYLKHVNHRKNSQRPKSLTRLSHKGISNSKKRGQEMLSWIPFPPTSPRLFISVPRLSAWPPFILHTLLWCFQQQPRASTSTYRLRIPESESPNQASCSELIICIFNWAPGHLYQCHF